MNTMERDNILFNQTMLDEEYPLSEQEKKSAEKASQTAIEVFEKGLIKSLEFRKYNIEKHKDN